MLENAESARVGHTECQEVTEVTTIYDTMDSESASCKTADWQLQRRVGKLQGDGFRVRRAASYKVTKQGSESGRPPPSGGPTTCGGRPPVSYCVPRRSVCKCVRETYDFKTTEAASHVDAHTEHQETHTAGLSWRLCTVPCPDRVGALFQFVFQCCCATS